jgi:acetylornithine deacetylase/succinyl-diaminopimelate desuccinylase-like protein
MQNPIEFLKQYLSFQSVSTDPKPEFLSAMEGAREHVSSLLKEIGFTVEVVKTHGHPIILAKRLVQGDVPHVLLYGHYDVQPADPLELWASPPFEPTVRGERLYARGAADNKGPCTAMLYGLAKALEANPHLALSITILLEGEEEIGSPSIPSFLEAYRKDLQADLIILSDTCSPSEDQIVITTGLRGVCSLELSVQGPKTDLHSGLYGGAVHNPIQVLADLCSSLHSADGLVNVPGFYEGITPAQDWEKAEIQKLPYTEQDFQSLMGVPYVYQQPGYTPQEAIRFLPTLEFNGIGGGYQGPGSKTIIPSKAFVKITCRLVPPQDNKTILARVKEALLARCPKTVTLEIKDDVGGSPYRMMHPNRNPQSKASPVVKEIFKACEEAIGEVFEKAPLFMPEGGSIPIIGLMKEILGLDALMIGLFTPKDALHAPNESMSLSLFEKSIAAYKLLFDKIAKH